MVHALPQRILVAPSGFKESLDASAVAAAIGAGVRRALPGAVVKAVPIADGGEGTAETLARATGGHLVPAVVTGPVGQKVGSHYAMLGGESAGTAVVEMAAAAGLRLVPRAQRDPGTTTSYGVGELIAAAIDAGATKVLVGCGDSGTSDGGMGALQALGARILDGKGRELTAGGNQLGRIDRLDLAGLHPALAAGTVQITLALNQHNILTGPRGVARVFGPQKGATPQQVEAMSTGFERWAAVLRRDALASARETDFATAPGTGASGGLGAGLAAVGAVLLPRFEAILDSGLAGIDLDSMLRGADLVITAEGAIDFQTPKGKVPAEVARRAGLQGVPVVALAGTLGRGCRDVHDIGIDAIASIVPIPMTLQEAVDDGERLLIEAAERFMRTIILGASMAASKLSPHEAW
ncbi:glycerate kinase [Arthrobacter sp. MYb224]|uniref:glycerate kinase family protein n=1 Tax=unclassified Arthrobacter TaxID=235627 RepID=UPI000CFB02B4|nr:MULTISPECIES: glycerate kinase [unclassified Arthrobacter]PQZ98145.1 glycerate kinase [Arthrobacter sp. MYb224]PRA02448.1 glycerate kinase [Arthrobacter sp. MYb229]PRB50609.1 glycerate kinase [Arthrobacter sp. MYb216]